MRETPMTFIPVVASHGREWEFESTILYEIK